MSARWNDGGPVRRPSRRAVMWGLAGTTVALAAWAGGGLPYDAETSPLGGIDQPAREYISPPEIDCPTEDMVLVEVVADGYDLHVGDKLCVHIDELRP